MAMNRTTGTLLVVLVVLACAFPVCPLHAQSLEYQTLSPGKVRFVQTEAGRWVEFSGSWEKRGLITGGGFVLYTDKDGILLELANTGSGSLGVPEHARGLSKPHEGMRHGVRAPSLAPDDDHDGRVDEDRLDGIDNDGDGAIDEDFAAIGDEMIATEFFARDNEAGYNLEFHQEAYAWSLPNIDGAVMFSVRIRNAGDAPIENLRIVPYYERKGYLELSDRIVNTPGDTKADRQPSRIVVSSEGRASSLALIAFPAPERQDVGWISAYADRDDDLRASVSRMIADAAQTAPDESPQVNASRTLGRVERGAVVYLISPSIDILAPGQETRFDVALVATPSRSLVADAATRTLETYLGDGTNLYIPPPVSIKPRMMWGTYRVDEDNNNALLIELDRLGEGAVTPEEISSFAGIDPALVEKNNANDEEIILHGIAASRVLDEERTVLKGRLESGAFFELVLRPKEVRQSATSREAEMFWKTPGKLEPELLNGSPNPFRNATSIFYEIPALIEQEDGTIIRSEGSYDTSVKIYNVSGRLVSVLVEDRLFPGTHSITWSAVDDQGNAVASGVYYLKLRIESRFITKRLIVLK